MDLGFSFCVFSPRAINTSFGFNKVNGPFFQKRGRNKVCLFVEGTRRFGEQF